MAGDLPVYIGTYTGRGSQGIYLLRMGPAGTLSSPELAAESVNPSFLAAHPSGRVLYAADETDDFAGAKSGAVSAFAVAPGSGKLTLLNQQPSGGAGPCHLTVDAAGRNVLVANYVGGSVSVLPLDADGRLGEPTEVIQHRDSDPGSSRAPHAHSVNLDVTQRFAFVADLGLDRVFVYRFDAVGGKLSPAEPPWAATAKGSGPRHLALSDDGRFAWVLGEMGNSVTVFAAISGVLSEVQTISTLPAGFSGESYASEVRAHPSGRFLYVSNRGHDSIAAFTVEASSGRLSSAGWTPSGGKWPRHFAVDPSGAHLLAADQRSDSVVVFRLDPASGAATPTGSVAEVPGPSCVLFLPRPLRT